jgi:hypothetical protein
MFMGFHRPGGRKSARVSRLWYRGNVGIVAVGQVSMVFLDRRPALIDTESASDQTMLLIRSNGE